MSNIEILEEALRLSPQDRYVVVEELLKSLDIHDESVDDAWAQEAKLRVENYRNNNTKTLSFEEVFQS